MPQGLNPEQVSTQPPNAGAGLVVRQQPNELAVRSLGVIAEVFGTPIAPDALVKVADSPDSSPERLLARRALRFAEALTREDSPLAQVIIDDDTKGTKLYAAAEAALLFGAASGTYVNLVQRDDLTPSQATGMYALREEIAEDYLDGSKVSLGQLTEALEVAGIDVRRVYRGPSTVAAELSERGAIRQLPSGRYILDILAIKDKDD